MSETWIEAQLTFDAGRFEEAAVLFRQLGMQARAIYNTAICYLNMCDHESAVCFYFLISFIKIYRS